MEYIIDLFINTLASCYCLCSDNLLKLIDTQIIWSLAFDKGQGGRGQGMNATSSLKCEV